MLVEQAARLLVLIYSTSLVLSAPPGFPSSGNGLWYTTPGQSDMWATEWLPIGNGYLAATFPGGTFQETAIVNIESLWSGGPFQDSTYNGGNQPASAQTAMAQDMQGIRQAIFQSPNGTIEQIEQLMTAAGAYGSYAAAGYLMTTLNTSGDVSNYYRWLDLDVAVARTIWTQGSTTFLRESFCSHPAQACVQYINTSDSSVLPGLTYAFDIEPDFPTPNITCLDNSTLRFNGFASVPGMGYEILAHASTSPNATTFCVPSGANATLGVEGATEAWITWMGATEYDMSAGNSAHNFSFRGVDPDAALRSLLYSVATPSTSYESLLAEHTADYAALMSRFSLDLGQTPDLSTPTDALKTAYQTTVGNPYLEWLLFNYGRYMLASSARGSLPANLQGKWANLDSNPWGADSNINIQMNYWFAEMTNMDLVTPLFDYIQNTWQPRGEYTAQVLYNISRGWVTHDEIFGHTGMKLEGNSAQWADYPESAVWMMIAVWDHFDYTNDVTWFKAQGWPLLKSVAQFHLDKLVPDLHFNDNTLVVNPCNSPEQLPITFGCAHAQQLIWQLFNAVEKGFSASGDSDTAFLQEVTTARAQMDKGIHIGSWGQLQEWKFDMDSPTDTHRHLSHLIGLYPGYAVASYDESIQSSGTNYSKSEVLEAAEVSLIHRGNGTGPDADSGWEKVWRAACWAQLGNASEFYFELSYALERNFAANLWSIYSFPPTATTSIFQIDANFGFPSALLNALIQAPDVANASSPLVITILPALPSAWPSGSITGSRIRGGLTLDLAWAGGKPTSATLTVDQSASPRPIQVVYAGVVVTSFTSSAGLAKTIGF
ncbi:glycoside hydrolase family 95 protein [Amylocystis lapponica]|nr:glycoside hydrolase family 95 protein [Amylocystis lapponica]